MNEYTRAFLKYLLLNSINYFILVYNEELYQTLLHRYEDCPKFVKGSLKDALKTAFHPKV